MASLSLGRTKLRLLSTFMLALGLVVQPFSIVMANTAYAADSVTVCADAPATCDYATLQEAVDGVVAGDTVVVTSAAPQTVTSTVLVNKSITITGEPGAQINTSGSAHVFVTTAPNVTISNLSFVKTDSVNQNMINVQGVNTTISDNSFSGQYTLALNDHVSRALEVSTTTGLVVSGNSFENLRQPAYFNDGTQGTVSNNYVDQTRGWVAVANTDLDFTDNSWGENAVDIAFIPGSPNNYTDIVAISDANNGAIIQNQQSGEMSTVFVDGSVVTSGNGYKLSPYKTIVEALNVVASGGVIELGSDLTTGHQITITKAVTLNGNGHTITGAFVKTNNSNNSVIGVQSDNVTITNLTVDAVSGATNLLHGVNIYNSDDVVLTNVIAMNGRSGVVVGLSSTVNASNISTSGNTWHGINVDKPGAHLTISGTNSHNEARQIFVDDKTVGTVIDIENQYSRFEQNGAYTYVLLSDMTDANGSISLPVSGGVATTPTNSPLVLSGAQATAVIPEGTTISSNPAWNGTIDAPTITSFVVPGTVDTALAITVGSSTYSLVFDHAVQLQLPGQGGKRVGFQAPGGNFTEITAVCTTFDPVQADAQLAAAGANECKMSFEGNLYIWTNHFTIFATFTPQPVSQGSGTTSSTSTTRSGNFFSPTVYDDTWMEGANTEEGETYGSVKSNNVGLSGIATVNDNLQEVPTKGISWYWWLLGGVLAAGAWSLVSLLRSGRFNR